MESTPHDREDLSRSVDTDSQHSCRTRCDRDGVLSVARATSSHWLEAYRVTPAQRSRARTIVSTRLTNDTPSRPTSSLPIRSYYRSPWMSIVYKFDAADKGVKLGRKSGAFSGLRSPFRSMDIWHTDKQIKNSESPTSPSPGFLLSQRRENRYCSERIMTCRYPGSINCCEARSFP